MANAPHADRGQRLSAAINASTFSQASLAEKLGISRQALNDIVAGRAPGAKHLPAMAGLLGVPELWLREGGPLPERLRGRAGGAVPDRPQAKAALDVVKEAWFAWATLRSKDPKAFEERLSKAPKDMRGIFGSQAMSPWRLTDGDGLLTAMALVDVMPADQKLFLEGMRQIVEHGAARDEQLGRKQVSSEPADLSLPLEQFATVRGALLVVRAERLAFERSPRDVERALGELWRRQLRAPWPVETARRLQAQREQDLGPDLDVPVED